MRSGPSAFGSSVSLNDNDVDHSFQTDPVNVDNNDVAVAVGLDADASN